MIGAFVLFEKYIYPHTEAGWLKYYEKKRLITKKDHIDATISRVWNNRGIVIKFYNNDTLYIFPVTRNYLYSKDAYDIEDVVRTGVKLFKRSDTDTIWVQKGSNRYYYRIGEVLNKDKRKRK
ncbi:MAG TPA: hypothetical protein ENJ39_08605 [Flammeovirgaceae bacterium]|nr:hypothetical protein [Flammeovirgaceae bacterium]